MCICPSPLHDEHNQIHLLLFIIATHHREPTICSKCYRRSNYCTYNWLHKLGTKSMNHNQIADNCEWCAPTKTPTHFANTSSCGPLLLLWNNMHAPNARQTNGQYLLKTSNNNVSTVSAFNINNKHIMLLVTPSFIMTIVIIGLPRSIIALTVVRMFALQMQMDQSLLALILQLLMWN